MNIKRNILLIIVTLLATIATAQRTYETNPDRKRGFNWLFGDSIWLDFKTNPPTQRNGSQLKALESAATISDTAGNLLFYTDGMTVWNANHQIIVNGTGLNGNESSSQGSLLIPQPNNDSVFYLFTTDWQGKSKGFCYHTIILDKQNINKSRIKEKNIKLLPSVFESISATTHANGLWKWIVVRNASGKGINAFLLTDKGINVCPVYSETQLDCPYIPINCQSNSSFNFNANLFCISYLNFSTVEFLKFDNLNGNFYLLFLNIGTINGPTGITFSKRKKCYIVERDFNIYNLNETTITKYSINNHNDSFMIVGSRLTPYDQIYYNIFDSMFIGLVDKPELANAKFKLKGLLLNKKCTNGLTNFDNSYNNTIGVNFTYSINCSNNQVVLKGLDTFNASSFIWKTRQNNISSWQTIGNTKTLSYTYNDTGVYNIQFIASRGIIKDTIIKTIYIYPKIKTGFLGKDTAFEVGVLFNKKLNAPDNIHCYNWYYLDTLRSNSNEFTASKKGTYICKITSKAFCTLKDTITITECINNLQQPSLFRNRDTLRTWHSNADSFVWFRNNQIYKITKESFLKLTDTGTYRVEAAKKGHCNRGSVSQIMVNRLIVKDIRIEDLGIRVFPNPSNGKVIIENSGLSGIKFILSNTLGQILYSGNLNNESSQLEFEYSKGLYILTFQTNQQIINYKLIIQ